MKIKLRGDFSGKLKKLSREMPEQTEKVLLAVMGTAKGYATMWTPVDTSTLINSLDYKVSGNNAIIFYKTGFAEKTGFNYAEYLHENTNWKPGSHPRANERATPHFLIRAFTDKAAKEDINRNIEMGYKF